MKLLYTSVATLSTFSLAQEYAEAGLARRVRRDVKRQGGRAAIFPDEEATEGVETARLFDSCTRDDLESMVLRDAGNGFIDCEDTNEKGERRCRFTCAEEHRLQEGNNIVYSSTFSCYSLPHADGAYYWVYEPTDNVSQMAKCIPNFCPAGIQLPLPGKAIHRRGDKHMTVRFNLNTAEIQRRFENFHYQENFYEEGFTVVIEFNQSVPGIFQSMSGRGLSTNKAGNAVALVSYASDNESFFKSDKYAIEVRFENPIGSYNTDIEMIGLKIHSGSLFNVQCMFGDEGFTHAGVNPDSSGKMTGLTDESVEVLNDFGQLIPFSLESNGHFLLQTCPNGSGWF